MNTISGNQRGGKRPGAGRPKGSATKKTREIADKAATAGQTPLEFLLGVMRGESYEFKDRLDAAKAAASYVHPRLTSVAVGGDEDATPIRHEFAWLPEGS